MVRKSSATPTKKLFVFTEHENVADYDWRLQAVTTVAEDVRGPSGILHKIGAPVVVVCPVEYDSRTHIRFRMPSITGMLLDEAHRLWAESSDILALFANDGDGTAASPRTNEDDASLISLLQRRLGAVVFAYTAIEAFCNEVIGEAYSKKAYVYEQPSPKHNGPYTLEEIERYLSLSDKLNGVLPEVCGVKALRKSKHWASFRQLQTIRHFIIHPKLAERIQASPRERALWKMLSDASFHDYARDAKAIMMHYASNGSHPARWLHKCPQW